MKCPNCGADMAEGSLYCEHCGEDIHIVPDYEPELEFSMVQSMTSILAEVNGGDQTASEGSGQKPERPDRKSGDGRTRGQAAPPPETRSGRLTESPSGKPPGVDTLRPLEKRSGKGAGKQRKRRAIWIAAVCAGVLLILSAAGGLMLYRYNSYEYQLGKAVQCAAAQRYSKAIQYYTRALELNDKDIEVRFAFAEVYYQKGNKIEYEYLLRDIIHDEQADDGQLERAYGKLIAIYRDKKDFKTINDLLLACDNEKIQNTYQSYLAKPPEFSYQEGYYTEIVPLKLTATTSGRIYYTLDGTAPDENSMEYTAPIFLDNGDHVVKACFVNEFGVVSGCVTKEFHVSITQVAAPDISVISGEYYVPMLIEVLDYYDGDVYYTTDGSDPGLHSQPYTGPIPMPVGKSTFKFAFVKEDGSISDIAERNYQLRLNTLLTAQDAERKIMEYMIYAGKIYDSQGHYSEESEGQYKYQYQCVLNFNQESDYFMVAEIYRDEDGNMTKTGSYFGVDIYSGALYKLQTDENSNYTLVEILIDSQEG